MSKTEMLLTFYAARSWDKGTQEIFKVNPAIKNCFYEIWGFVYQKALIWTLQTSFWLQNNFCESITREHKFKRWFCTSNRFQKSGLNVKNFWYTKINLSQNIYCIPITFNNQLKARFSNKKYIYLYVKSEKSDTKIYIIYLFFFILWKASTVDKSVNSEICYFLQACSVHVQTY